MAEPWTFEIQEVKKAIERAPAPPEGEAERDFELGLHRLLVDYRRSVVQELKARDVAAGEAGIRGQKSAADAILRLLRARLSQSRDGWGPALGFTGCYSCGRPYTDLGFPDLIVPDAVWDRISPTGDGGGLLCPACIIAACTEQADTLGPFSATFESGPLVTQRLLFGPGPEVKYCAWCSDPSEMNEEWTFCPFCGGRLGAPPEKEGT